MIVKELLDKYSDEEILDYLCKNYNGSDGDSNGIYFVSYLKRMRDMQPTNTDRIVLAYRYLDENEDGLLVLIFSKQEIMEEFQICPELENFALYDNSINCSEFIKQINVKPVGMGFILTKWEEILGCEIDEKNIAYHVMESELEFLCYIIYEMTIFGFPKEQENVRFILDDRVESCKQNLEKNCIKEISFSDLFPDLVVSKIDWDDMIEQMNFDAIVTLLSKYYALKDYVERH